MGRSRSRSRSRDRNRRRYSRSRSGSHSGSDEQDGIRVHVSDLGIDCDKREIERAFEKFGPLQEVWLAKNPPCFAFIVFYHRDDAEDSIREMDGKLLCGGRVRVSFARPRTRGMRRRRGFDPNLRCYQCGERGHFSRDCDSIWSYRTRRYSRSRSRSRSRDRRRSNRDTERSRSRERPKRERSRERSGSRDRGRREKSRTASPSRRKSGEGNHESIKSPRRRSSERRSRRDSHSSPSRR